MKPPLKEIERDRDREGSGEEAWKRSVFRGPIESSPNHRRGVKRKKICVMGPSYHLARSLPSVSPYLFNPSSSFLCDLIFSMREIIAHPFIFLWFVCLFSFFLSD
jgi:hypothetical protein